MWQLRLPSESLPYDLLNGIVCFQFTITNRAYTDLIKYVSCQLLIGWSNCYCHYPIKVMQSANWPMKNSPVISHVISMPVKSSYHLFVRSNLSKLKPASSRCHNNWLVSKLLLTAFKVTVFALIMGKVSATHGFGKRKRKRVFPTKKSNEVGFCQTFFVSVLGSICWFLGLDIFV